MGALPGCGADVHSSVHVEERAAGRTYVRASTWRRKLRLARGAAGRGVGEERRARARVRFWVRARGHARG